MSYTGHSGELGHVVVMTVLIVEWNEGLHLWATLEDSRCGVTAYGTNIY